MTATKVEVETQIGENVTVLLHRAGLRQSHVADAVGISQPTLSRRVAGTQPWMFWEVQALAEFFQVTLDELTTGLPSRGEWQARWELRACRDSNPKPSDLYLARVLAPFVLGRCPSCGAWTYDGRCGTPHARSCHSGLDASWVLAA